jgi:hypothetical protein
MFLMRYNKTLTWERVARLARPSAAQLNEYFFNTFGKGRKGVLELGSA